MSELNDKLLEIKRQKDEYILPENLKKDVIVYGVTGTLEPGSGGGDVKLFDTEEHLQQDPSPSEGDLAVVYREEIQPIDENSEFDSCIFPNTVVLSEAFTDNIYGSFSSTDGSWFDGNVDMSSSSFRFNGFGDKMIRVEYTSQDGITYTRTDGGEELQEFGTTIKWGNYETFNSVIGNFMKIGGNYFDGLYQYSEYVNNSYVKTGANLSNIEKDGSYITNEEFVYNIAKDGILSSYSSFGICNYTTTTYKDINVINMTEGYGFAPCSTSSWNNKCMLVYDEYTNKYFLGYSTWLAEPAQAYNDIEVLHFYNNEIHTELHHCTLFKTYVTTMNYRFNLYLFDDIDMQQKPFIYLAHYFSSGAGESEVEYLKINSNTVTLVNGSLYLYYVSNKFYNDKKYFPAKSQLDATPEYVYEKEFYGKNGVDIGILNNGNIINDNIKNIYLDIANMFSNGLVLYDNIKFRNLEFSELPFKLDTSNVTTMNNMFCNCTHLTNIPLFDTSRVVNMSAMFSGCQSLTSVPQLDTSNVTNMDSMFSQCISLTTIPLLDTGEVKEMGSMFSGCQSLTSVPQLDTSNVTNMYNTFYNCTNLTTVPLLDLSSVTSVNRMFYVCTSLNNTSLNNILAMCITAVKLTSGKTLANLGLTKEQATTCQSLSNWSAFVNAGWTTGY